MISKTIEDRYLKQKKELNKQLKNIELNDIFYQRIYSYLSPQYGIDLNEIDPIDMFTAFYCCFAEVEYNEIADIIDNNKKLFKNIKTAEESSVILAAVNFIVTFLKKEELVKIVENKNSIVGTKIDYSLLNSNFSGKFIESAIESVEEFILNYDMNLQEIITLEYLDKDAFEDGLKVLFWMKKFVKSKSNKFMMVNDPVSKIRLCGNIVGDKEYVIDIVESLLSIIPEMDRRLTRNKKEKKEIRKNLNIYDELITWINNSKDQKEVSNIPVSLLTLKDEKLRYDTLKDIYSNNQKYYNELEKQHKKLSDDELCKYRSIFANYNIQVEDDEIDLEISKETLNDMLDSLQKLDIKDKKQILSLLQLANLEKVKEIVNLSDRKYLSQEFIKQHLSILMNDSDEITTIKENINLLQENQVKKEIIKNSNDNLLMPSDFLEKQLGILKDYQLLDNINKTESIDFLNSATLEDKIDLLLELGYENILQDNLSILNYPDDNLKRLIVLNRINIPLNTIDEVNSILSNKKFMIPDQELDTYIFEMKHINLDEKDEKISKDEFLQKLEENSISNRLYQLNGVLISKNRIKRNLENSSAEVLSQSNQIECIIKNGHYDTNAYQKFSSFIAPSSNIFVKKDK